MPVPPAVTVVETGDTWTCLLPCSVTAPGLARAAVRTVLADWGLGRSASETVLLVVSELVTDSVVRGSAAPSLRLVREETEVRVSVSDTGSRTPSPSGSPAGARPGTERGRGLLLVDAVARAWGTDGATGGGVVWARLDLAVAG